MNKLNALISYIEQTEQLLDMVLEQQRLTLSLQFSKEISNAHQKVSLAEKKRQVKNACSPVSSD
ncbi:endonuclease [Solibacillus sp. CAU 1738]|uniref:endonuclease n=1 Tax=Solibacillus sp. CAU 1738 TaxID=3140363 RepID=UPI003261A61F